MSYSIPRKPRAARDCMRDEDGLCMLPQMQGSIILDGYEINSDQIRSERADDMESMYEDDVLPEKLDIILDLDNTIIFSVAFSDLESMTSVKDLEKLEYKDMGCYYRIYKRPYLSKFLDFLFEHFNVSVWTAASRDYALFIINYMMLEGRCDVVKNIFTSDDCKLSCDKFSYKSPKDLNYLYHHFPSEYRQEHTIIIDDLPDVFDINPENCIKAPCFDVEKMEDSTIDMFLLGVIPVLQNIKDTYNFYQQKDKRIGSESQSNV